MRQLDQSYVKRVSKFVELVQGKWTMSILCAMQRGPVRLSELNRVLPSASKKALTMSLRTLEAAKIIVRRDLSASMLHVEYELTKEIEDSLIGLLDHIAYWSEFYEALHSSPDVEGANGQDTETVSLGRVNRN